VADDSLILVHLSDIHFRHRGSTTAAVLDLDLRAELVRDAVTLTRELGSVTGVLVTGDVAFAGKREEYEVAEAWLDSLCDALRCERERVWAIPGNHDVDRDTHAGTAIQDMHSTLRSRSGPEVDLALDRYLRDPNAARALLSPHAEYNVFARRYGCETTPEQLFWEQPVRLNDGSELRIRGVNSAIVCNSGDDKAPNEQVLGRRQVVLSRAQADEDPVEYLFLCHHPAQFIIDQDEVADYLRRARILLFGHKHKQRTEIIGGALRIYAGAVQPGREEREWQPTYNVISIRVAPDPRRLQIAVWPRVWDAERTRFRPGFTESDEAYDQYSFNLPARPIRPTTVEVIENNMDPAAEGELQSSLHLASSRPAATGLSRRDVFQFFSLPYQVRLQIALDLGLLSDEDEGLEEPERFRRVLLRVVERGITGEFVALLQQQ
jgi:hypothetical protein